MLGADSPEQAALREVVRDFARQHADASAWKRLTGELGLTGLAIPERYGGAGATLAEVAVAAEEIGRALLPVPYLSTALAGAVLSEGSASDGGASDGGASDGGASDGGASDGGASDGGASDGGASDGGAAGQFLPGIADGTLPAAFALSGEISVAGGRLAGVASHVLDGAEAGLFLVRAGGGLHAVRAADASVTPAGTLDQTRSQATVEFRGSPAAEVAVGAERAEDLLRVLLAAESAAAAGHCLDATVDYLQSRVQFGRPIGAFQALKHRCADLAVEVSSAQATAGAAVRAAAGSPGELPVLAPLAKRYCADVFFRTAAEMIQLHGGIGFTWEHDAHRYLKRAKATQLLHGSPAELRRLVAHRAGLF
jgi:alkylation response protein AidB-like acyl-CoA dehydrogenase